MSRIALDWVVGWTSSPDKEPEEWVPATVPGNVQLDWARAHDWPDWWVGDNFKQYRWMEDVYWVYRAVLPELPAGQKMVLANGIDHEVDARLGNRTKHCIGSELRIGLGSQYGGNEQFDIIVYPAPSLPTDPVVRKLNTETTKAGVFYGWDFAPRLVPLGISGVAYVGVGEGFTAQCFTSLKAGRGELICQGTANQDVEGSGIWEVLDPSGTVVYSQTFKPDYNIDLSASIDSPELWWPNRYGDQPLYTSRITANERTLEQKIGFRDIRLVPYEGMWQESRNSPGTRWEPPITLEVNGKRIFAKGANWVPPSMFPGSDTRETYRALLQQCKDAGFNLLRVWGGGNVPKDDFFDLCDEMGILVWQEFPLACARYEGTKDYLKELRELAHRTVANLRHHPSLAVWCGGNELFCPWSRMTDQDAALRMLNTVCYGLDPDRPFLPTSPLMGMAHGGYTFVYLDGREGMAAFQEANATAYTEFGSSGPASVEVLKTFMTEEELWPPRKGTAWETHNGFGAWDGHPDSWLMLPMLEEYFGPFETLEDMVWAGQLLQSEGMRHKYEEARRQKPRCSMALAWCLNEPWPTAANNSLISWPAAPKPAMQAVTEACRPTLLSLRIPKFRWSSGETMRVEPFVLNDAYESYPGGEAVISVDGVEVAQWTFLAIEENRNARGEAIEFVLPELGRTFEVTISCADQPEWTNRYTLGRFHS